MTLSVPLAELPALAVHVPSAPTVVLDPVVLEPLPVDTVIV
ncbi:hypothetical protein [Lactococcus fujiensis]|nr:hypothetical protein [Lactococcus fujiensis]